LFQCSLLNLVTSNNTSSAAAAAIELGPAFMVFEKKMQQPSSPPPQRQRELSPAFQSRARITWSLRRPGRLLSDLFFKGH